MNRIISSGLTRRAFLLRSAALTVGTAWLAPALRGQPLPQTLPLEGAGDLARKMVDGMHRFLDRETAAAAAARPQLWKSAPIPAHRDRLKKILGITEARLPVKELEYLGSTSRLALVRETPAVTIHTVRWPVLEGVHGEGLLLQPRNQPVARVIVLPDADQTPELLAGLEAGSAEQDLLALRLAERGCQVLVPTLVNRQDTRSGSDLLGRFTNQPHREFVYRMAFEMGRHIIGYEVMKIHAALDWLTDQNATMKVPIGLAGHVEGGLLALHGAATDGRVDVCLVSGYFGPREQLHDEPIYRNVWSLLREFGDAELAAMIAPARLIIVSSAADLVAGPPETRPGRAGGAAPGRIRTPDPEAAEKELQRAAPAFEALKARDHLEHVKLEPNARFGHPEILAALLKGLGQTAKADGSLTISATDTGSSKRQARQVQELVNHVQRVMRDSELRRQQTFWSRLDLSSLQKYEASCDGFRKYFWEEVIGKLPPPTLPMNPRTRQIHDEPRWRGHEVTLDLYPDVFAEGTLLVPKDIKDGEQRPVVVCQHGLEGRPSDVVNPREKTPYYNSFGAQLADRGFVVFAPQNPYIFRNDFRQLQRKANPLKLSLFSFIVRQHERILDWLATLPFVDGQRLGFYGLSYGGKTAMRVPALLNRYCLSICSGDFNEWIWKNASVDFRGSYMFTGEYEMFEFDLGHTFNYAEMAALIAPRPFMVERGHDDGVGIDEWVAYEYAKVRRLYAKLGIPDRTEIEFFNGGHVINGKGTFAFLHRHLNWPAPA